MWPDEDLDARDPGTHFGMGSRRYPIAKDLWEEAIRESNDKSRGGLRAVANQSLPEMSLVMKPFPYRLKAPKSYRTYCRRNHKGLCITQHGGIADQVRACVTHLKKHESHTTEGCRTYRFYAASLGLDRDRSCDLFFSLGPVRLNPKYKALYFRGTALLPGDGAPPFPFEVTDDIESRPCLGFPGVVEDGYTRLRSFTSWALAVLLAQTFPGPVAMELLHFQATSISRTIRITGAEIVCTDIKVPAPSNAIVAVVPRALRSASALVQLAPPELRDIDQGCGALQDAADAADGVGTQKRRKRGLGALLGVDNTSRSNREGDASEDTLWWKKELPKRRRRCEGVATTEPTADDTGGESNTDSDNEPRKKYTKDIEELQRLQEAATHRKKKQRDSKPPAPDAPPPPPAPHSALVPLESSQAVGRKYRHGPRLAASSSSSRGPPILPRRQMGSRWGRFWIAPDFNQGTYELQAWTAKCDIHKSGGKSCNKSLSLGKEFTRDEGLLRIKNWCLRGHMIPDDAEDAEGAEDADDARTKHMRICPRSWEAEILMPEAECDDVSSC